MLRSRQSPSPASPDRHFGRKFQSMHQQSQLRHTRHVHLRVAREPMTRIEAERSGGVVETGKLVSCGDAKPPHVIGHFGKPGAVSYSTSTSLAHLQLYAHPTGRLTRGNGAEVEYYMALSFAKWNMMRLACCAGCALPCFARFMTPTG